MENKKINEIGGIIVEFRDNFAYCYRNAGYCYGNIRKTIVDCKNISEDNIIEHIREYAGDLYADYLITNI